MLCMKHTFNPGFGTQFILPISEIRGKLEKSGLGDKKLKNTDFSQKSKTPDWCIRDIESISEMEKVYLLHIFLFC